MISWRITAIGGWAGRRLAEFQLGKYATDLSDYEEQQVRQVVIAWRTTKGGESAN
jgi:hypothetical protein